MQSWCNPGGNVTGTDLIKELNALQDSFSWYLTRTGRIRAHLKSDTLARVFDPITAVAYFRCGEFYPEGCWTQAARMMDLVYTDCAEIVAAINYEWDPGCRQGVLRYQLLDILRPQKENPDASRSGSFLGDIVFRGRKGSAPTTS
jgi:hypothetical protein